MIHNEEEYDVMFEPIGLYATCKLVLTGSDWPKVLYTDMNCARPQAKGPSEHGCRNY